MKSQIQPHVTLFHLGSRWNYDLPVTLSERGLLAQFYTDAYCGAGSALAPLSRHFPKSSGALGQLVARRRSELPKAKVTAFNLLGLEYGFRLRRIHDAQARLQLILEINRRFNQLVCRQGFSQETNLVFGMNTASLEAFQSLEGRGIKRLMDQNLLPMSVETEVLAEEYSRWPNWAEDKLQDWQHSHVLQQWLAREEQEWNLADRILCACPATAKALLKLGVSESKLRVIPYPVKADGFYQERSLVKNRPLRLLFVGQINLRKGVPYFLEMLKRLHPGSFEARMVGAIYLNAKALAPYQDLCTFTGMVPRSQMSQHYAWADVFVFPSLCDSAPGATNEALAAGLPIITTEGAGTVVEDGVEGWVVKDRDIDALTERVVALDQDRALWMNLSHNALRKAQSIDVQAYGDKLQQVCTELLLAHP
jgi:glycosyltransferase involved in cell wall biosynthesis